MFFFSTHKEQPPLLQWAAAPRGGFALTLLFACGNAGINYSISLSFDRTAFLHGQVCRHGDLNRLQAVKTGYQRVGTVQNSIDERLCLCDECVVVALRKNFSIGFCNPRRLRQRRSWRCCSGSFGNRHAALVAVNLGALVEP